MKNKVHHSFFKLTFITMISLIFCFIFTISYSKYVLNANVGTLTLDVNGEVIPEKAYLLPGLEFNAIISEKNPAKIIVGDYSKYANEVKDVRTTAIAVDIDQSGVINLYMVDDVAYVLSKTQIYANQDSSGLFGIGVEAMFADDLSITDIVNLVENTKLKSIILENFNTSEVVSMTMMFFNFHVEEILGLDKLDTHLVETMEGMFYSAGGVFWDDFPSLKGFEDLSNFDTGNVTSMSNMFVGVKTDYPLDLSFFDTSKVENMEYMFEYASFPSLDVSTWNTESVTTMGCMFEGILVEELDLSSFDTHNVTNMYDMFGEPLRISIHNGGYIQYPVTSPLKTVYVDSTKWSTENLSSKTTSVFKGLYPFLVGEKGTAYQYSNQYYSHYSHPELDTNSWIRARVDGYEGLPGYFTEKGHSPYVEEDKKAVLNKRLDFLPLASRENNSYGDWYGSWNNNIDHIVFGKYSEIFPQIQEKAKNDNILYYNSDDDLAQKYMAEVNTEGGEFGKNIIPIITYDDFLDENNKYQGTCGTLYLLSKYDTPIYAPEDCSNLFAYRIFDEQYDGPTRYYNDSLRFLQTIDFNHCFDTSNTTNMRAMFANPSLQEIKGLDALDTTHVTDMSGMFLNARSLKNLDLSHFDTSNVEHMNAMFGNIGLETLDLSSFDTHKVQSMENMFGWTCENLLEFTYGFDSIHYDRVTVHNDYLLKIKPYNLDEFNMVMLGGGEYSDTSNAPLKTIYVNKDKWSTESIINKETEQIWYGRFNNLMGGAGTQFNAELDFDGDPLRTATYACIDSDETPGYLTAKE